MDFAGAIKAGFQNYANFRGAASRPAFWYWRLFLMIVSIATTFLPVVGQLASLALFLPDLTISIRRTRDAGFTAWLQLLWVIPVALFIARFPEIVAFASTHQVDIETATDSELVQALGPILLMALPAFLALLAVQLFFFITYLLPTKTAEQGNKYVK
ncbi:MAG: DUF805 domain-containing protein [Rhodoluna sp.]|nr:DUF805 domain-containing protein [Rhodoluna sp.]